MRPIALSVYFTALLERTKKKEKREKEYILKLQSIRYDNHLPLFLVLKTSFIRQVNYYVAALPSHKHTHAHTAYRAVVGSLLTSLLNVVIREGRKEPIW